MVISIDLDLRDRREARFGVEVEDVHRIEPASPVVVSDLDVPPTVTVQGTVRALSDALDPQTNLVDLFATLPDDAHFMLNQPVTGMLRIQSAPTFVVPRSALLPVDDHLVVFTVEDGHAKRHTVRVGLQSEGHVELLGSDLQEGAQVVVEGVPALEDGMQVHVGESS